MTKECVIIEDEITYSLFGKCKLPFYVKATYIIEECNRQVSYTDEQLVKIASSRLDALIASRLEGADLLKIRTEGSFNQRGYLIRSDIVFLCEVGNEMAFEVE